MSKIGIIGGPESKAAMLWRLRQISNCVIEKKFNMKKKTTLTEIDLTNLGEQSYSELIKTQRKIVDLMGIAIKKGNQQELKQLRIMMKITSAEELRRSLPQSDEKQ